MARTELQPSVERKRDAVCRLHDDYVDPVITVDVRNLSWGVAERQVGPPCERPSAVAQENRATGTDIPMPVAVEIGGKGATRGG